MPLDYIHGLLGGAMIGCASLLLLAFEGRIFGVSGILAGILSRTGYERYWRVSATLGLLTGGLILVATHYPAFDFSSQRSTIQVAIAGLLVGIGTRMSGGCTSGHGVCGMSRLSPRSIVATMTFMLLGFVTATILAQEVMP